MELEQENRSLSLPRRELERQNSCTQSSTNSYGRQTPMLHPSSWKSLSDAIYKLSREFILVDRSIYRTQVVPMMKSLLRFERLYRRMIVYMSILILGQAIQTYYLTQYGFS